jgi:NAD(P)H-hydrate epimerase
VAAAVAWGVVVVLKGARTVVAAPDGRELTVDFEIPALGTAGSGDVLAGVVTSLVGQGLEPFEAAALGAYLHARAGADISLHLGDAGLMATDLLTAVPRVRRHLAGLADGAGRLGFDAPGREP